MIMLVGSLFALGSFWLVQVINRGDIGGALQGARTEPDYIIEKFSLVRMTLEGQPHYIISGDKLTHRPSDDSLDVVRPVVQNFGINVAPMTMHAKAAHINQNTSVVDLMGDVDIKRPPLGKSAGLSLKTEALTVFTDEDRMETKQPFQLVVGSTTIDGVGMKANNATGQLDIQSQMQLQFPPRAR
jgi:lipopolysaccharide export system protein LptC